MSKVFDLVLGVFREPGLVAELRDRQLPDDLALVIRLAAGEDAALQGAAGATGVDAETLLEASVFFLQQVLFAPGADAYRVLGASLDSPQEQLRENYRWLMKWLHPDRNQDGWEAVYADRVNIAWQDLKTPDRRAEYDRRLPSAAPQAPMSTGMLRRGAPVNRPASGPLLSGTAVRRLPTLVLGTLGALAAATVGIMYWAQSETSRELSERQRDRSDAIAADTQQRPPAPAGPAALQPADAGSAVAIDPEPASAAAIPAEPIAAAPAATPAPATAGIAAAKPAAQADPGAAIAPPPVVPAAAPPAVAAAEPGASAATALDGKSADPTPAASPPAPAPGTITVAQPSAARASTPPAPAAAASRAPEARIPTTTATPLAMAPATPSARAETPPSAPQQSAVASAPASVAPPAAPAARAPPPVAAAPGRSDAEALVREFASAYAAGDLGRFDRLLSSAQQDAATLDSMRSRFGSTEMRYLEIQQLRWHPEAEQGHVRARFRDTYVPRGGRKAITESGEIQWTIRVDAGDARIASVARNDARP